jgi:hypothetical protein
MWSIETWGLNCLLNLLPSYNIRSQFHSLMLLSHTAVDISLGPFSGCFSNSWIGHLDITNGVSLCLELPTLWIDFFDISLSFSLSLFRKTTTRTVCIYLGSYGCTAKKISASKIHVSLCLCIILDMYFNMPVTNEVPYSVFRELYFRSVPFETLHNIKSTHQCPKKETELTIPVYISCFHQMWISWRGKQPHL